MLSSANSTILWHVGTQCHGITPKHINTRSKDTLESVTVEQRPIMTRTNRMQQLAIDLGEAIIPS